MLKSIAVDLAPLRFSFSITLNPESIEYIYIYMKLYTVKLYTEYIYI